VDDLHKEWNKHDGTNKGTHIYKVNATDVREKKGDVQHFSSAPTAIDGTNKGKYIYEDTVTNDSEVAGDKQHFSYASPVLEPVTNTKNILLTDNPDQPIRCNLKPSKTGPWSLDWLAQIPNKTAGKDVLKVDKFTFAASDNNFKHSAGFVKRVA